MMIGELLTPIFEITKTKLHIKNENKLFSLFQILRTFIIVNIGMFLFRCGNLSEFGVYLSKVVTSFNLYEVLFVFSTKSELLIPLVGFMIIFVIGIIKEKGIDIRLWLVNRIFIIRWLVYLFLIFTTMVMGIYGVEYGEGAAIYAQF